MKKIMSFVLALVLMLSVAVVPTYATGKNSFMPPGLAKKGGLPPGIAKKFMDIERYEWARSAIEKMAAKGVIKGVAEDEFAPAKSVTKVEALAMIIRVMGWDEEANLYRDQIQNGKKEDKLKNRLQDWGKGYIEVAQDRELIDEIDLAQENFNTPATRQEVAKYIIRAMDMDDEAQGYMDKDLRFKDQSAVQIGAVGYVYLIDKLEIMIGDNENNFQPNKPVTRAEMAKLVERLDGKVADDNTEETFNGVISDIDESDREITVKSGRIVRLFEVNSDTIIKIDGDREDFEDLMEGMSVKVFLEDDEVVRIYGETETTEFEGRLMKVEVGSEWKITIEVDDENKTFVVDEDVEIETEDDDVDIEDLHDYLGETMEIEVENNRVVKINIED